MKLPTMLIISFLIANSLNIYSKPKLSPNALQLKKISQNEIIESKYLCDKPLKVINNINYISAVIKINNNFSFQKAEAMGVKFGAKAGLILTAQIPVSSYSKFSEMDNIDYISVESGSIMHLDSARKLSFIDEALQGVSNLPTPYKGNGVVVGIIDVGYDYTHPVFYDTVTKNLRIKRVWDQTKSGIAPSGFNYGAEYTTDSTILAAKNDITSSSHGTHVAGIAAGCAWQFNGQYAGIAQESDIVLVALKQPRGDDAGVGDADFMDGVAYVFKYAESVGKPAVVNLSWVGPTLGARDGRSIAVQGMSDLTGAGKICVVSAGNNGQTKIHLKKSFTSKDTLLKSYITYSENLSGTPKMWLQCWGDSSKSFSINIAVIDTATKNIIAETEFYSTDLNEQYNVNLPLDKDTLKLNFHLSSEEFNKRPLALINLTSKKQYWFALKVKALDGNVNIWNLYVNKNSGYNSDFLSLGDPTAQEGDSLTTLSDMSSAQRIISVGAFSGKKSFTNLNGQTLTYPNGALYDIAPFSSVGPTSDGRIKPDIVADGYGVVSAVNSYDNSFGTFGSSASSVIRSITYNKKTYKYAILSGTSMSSPVVSGAVALLLSANPNLTPEQTLYYLQSSAYKDNFTGDNLPNTTWGAGKLNLTNALKMVLGISSVENGKIDKNIIIYPNPSSEFITINSLGDGFAKIELIDALGAISCEFNIDLAKNNTLNISNIPNGIYQLLIKQKDIMIGSTTISVLK